MASLDLGSVRLFAGVRSGAPITLRDGSLTPRALSLRVDFAQGGCFWNLSIGFDLERAGAARERRLIVDATRLALIALGLFTLVTGTSALAATLKGRISRD